MEPKTKFQKQVVAISQKLPKLTQKQIDWMSKQFTSYVTISRNRLYCLECNHKWKPDLPPYAYEVVKTTCPNCNTKSKFVQNYSIYTIADYLAILTTRKDFQITRIFFCEKLMRKKEKPRYFLREVIQSFVHKSGKVQFLSKTGQSFSYNLDSWAHTSGIEIRGQSANQIARESVVPYKYYPVRSILPVIKRNGFKGHFYDIQPSILFSQLLTNPKIETLLKAGRKDLLKYLFKNNLENVETHWSQIKLCLKHGYYPRDTSDYFDYLGMLADLGKDINNPFYACPDNLKKAHDRAVAKLNKRRRKAELKKRLDEINKHEKEFIKKRKRFFNLEIKNGSVRILPFKSVRECFEISQEHNHCLFINNYHLKDHSLLLLAYVNNTPAETIEFDLKRKKVIQSRGPNNMPTEHNKKILDVLSKNIHLISKAS